MAYGEQPGLIPKAVDELLRRFPIVNQGRIVRSDYTYKDVAMKFLFHPSRNPDVPVELPPPPPPPPPMPRPGHAKGRQRGKVFGGNPAFPPDRTLTE